MLGRGRLDVLDLHLAHVVDVRVVVGVGQVVGQHRRDLAGDLRGRLDLEREAQRHVVERALDVGRVRVLGPQVLDVLEDRVEHLVDLLGLGRDAELTDRLLAALEGVDVVGELLGLADVAEQDRAHAAAEVLDHGRHRVPLGAVARDPVDVGEDDVRADLVAIDDVDDQLGRDGLLVVGAGELLERMRREARRRVPAAQRLLDHLADLVLGHVTREDQVGVVGPVPGVVEGLDRVERDRVDVGVGRQLVPVGVTRRVEQHARESARERAAVGLLARDRDLLRGLELVERGLLEAGVASDVVDEVEREREVGLEHPRADPGVVHVRADAEVRTDLLDGLVDLRLGPLLGPLGQDVRGHAREQLVVDRAGLDDQLDVDDRDLVVLDHVDDQLVGQLELLNLGEVDRTLRARGGRLRVLALGRLGRGLGRRGDVDRRVGVGLGLVAASEREAGGEGQDAEGRAEVREETGSRTSLHGQVLRDHLGIPVRLGPLAGTSS